MKRFRFVLVLSVLGLHGVGQGFHLVGSASMPVPVSALKMTSIIFPAGVQAAVKVSQYVLIQRPRGVDNVIEMKAVRRNFPPTNLSVFGKDGRPYSFELHYVEDTAVVTFRVVANQAAPTDRPLQLTGLPVDQVALDSDEAKL